VYLVQFDGCVIGCMELEIVAVPHGWRPETEANA
jgi:nitrogen fixation protein NifZ